jgi:hypothetical protein
MKLKIENSGTEKFPFYQLLDEKGEEFCACDSLEKANKILKLFSEKNIIENKIYQLQRALRMITGCGLMDCRKALERNDWDINDSYKYLMKRPRII